ncbi:MAG: phosphatidate cytidylyltransferase [Stappiaceae bacterium]
MSGDPLKRKTLLESKIGTDFRLRLISALILAPIALGVVWVGGYAFLAMVSLGTVLILREWVGITAKLSATRDVWILAGIMIVALVLAALREFEYSLASIILVVGMAAILPQFDGARKWIMLGAAYTIFASAGLMFLRQGEFGLHAIFGLLILVWATDIGAYFSGRLIGGPKLWPAVSPNKTWSGATGGLLAAVLLSVLAGQLNGYHQLGAIAILAAFLSGISQLGDLAESALKRHFDVKDSGGIIPGHGGLLDRVDGLMLATIAAFFVAAALHGFADPTLLLVELHGNAALVNLDGNVILER